MKPKPAVLAAVFSALLMQVSVFEYGRVAAQRKTSLSARRQQELVKQISQRAERLYKTINRQSQRTNVSVNPELNNRFEDLLLTIDGLVDPRYRRHNLIIAMRIASAIEHLLLLNDVAPEVVLAWARLHADLDLLAKANGVRWTDAVITIELIADLANDVEKFLKGLQADSAQFHIVSLKSAEDLELLLENFRRSAHALNATGADTAGIRLRIEALRQHSRLITASLDSSSVSVTLRSDWRRVTSRLESFARLYLLDSASIQKLPRLNTLSALFTVNYETRNLR